jgi:DNA-binding GntR family transcriptional regulator
LFVLAAAGRGRGSGRRKLGGMARSRSRGGVGEAGRASSNAAEVAYRSIKQRIIRLELAPGAEFTEGQIAGELGLSRTPVREALAQLRLEGLVHVVRGAGCIVTQVTPGDVEEWFAVRMALETEAVGLATRYGARELEQLRELDRLCHAGDPNDIAAFLDCNRRFHVAIAGLTNRYLASVLNQVLERLERVMHLMLEVTGRPEDCIHGHEELLDALLGGSEPEARAVVRAEIASSQRKTLQALLASPAVTGAHLGTESRDRPAGA